MVVPTEPPASQSSGQPAGWPSAVRVVFRVVFIYWLLFCLEMGLAEQIFWMVPGLSHPMGWLAMPPQLASQWVGVHLFGLTGVAATDHPTGSGDTALSWVLSLCLLVLALAGAAVWTAVSERRGKRCEYRTLYAWLRLGLRFALGLILLRYGFNKVFDLQFQPPGLLYLTKTVGESSPMRLLWAFMGASVPYTVFGGLAEVVPGLLLLFRRTSTLGALLAAVVMANVVMLNFCYDVPVKLFSSQLLLLAIFLLLPDVAALYRIFFLGRAAALAGLHLPPWERRPLRLASCVLQLLVVGGMVYQTAAVSWRIWRHKPVGRAPLYGVWTLDKPDDPALPEPWAEAVFDHPDELVVLHPDGSREVYPARFDVPAQRIEFPEATKSSAFHWTRESDGTLALAGNWLGNPVTLGLHRKPIPDTFPLQTRGFHWVQEYPYNR